MTRSAISLVVIVALFGCTTLRPIANPSAAALAEDLKPGDVVELTTRQGETVALTVVRVTATELTGTTAAGIEQTVPLASISSVSRREVNTAATAGLVAGVIAGVVAIVVLAGGDSVFGGGGSSNDDNY